MARAMPLTKRFDGVFTDQRKIFTINLVKGMRVYGERLLNENRIEYREWNPEKSKLGAGIKNGLKQLPIRPNSRVLYLGAGEGTSISHVSDIVGPEGVVIGVDLGERTMKKFVWVCENRSNTLPVLADAHNTEAYASTIEEIGGVEVLFQDIAQPDQAQIFNTNARAFMKKGSHGLIAIKARSISQADNVKKIFDDQIRILETEWTILQQINLAPFETDHLLVHVQKK
jgi:fibrillarin-like pre-rRNA processing protein